MNMMIAWDDPIVVAQACNDTMVSILSALEGAVSSERSFLARQLSSQIAKRRRTQHPGDPPEPERTVMFSVASDAAEALTRDPCSRSALARVRDATMGLVDHH